MPFKFLEEVALADIAFKATGKDLIELLESSALAVFTVMVDLKTVKPKIEKTFTVNLQADNFEKLLFDFLSEIVFLKDTEGMVFKEIKVKWFPAKRGAIVKAILKGDLVNPKTQILGQDVKAVTMHNFKVEKTSLKKWKAFVILDI